MALFKFRFLAALFLGATSAWAANAQDSDAEFEARVRAFLLKNPEVILEAMTALSEREAEIALRQRIAQFPELFEDPPALGMGDPDAEVRVVEFFDYRCAPCKAIHPALMALVAETPELRIEMRHLPILSPASERGARFALAVQAVAGEEAYARAHGALWDLRGPLSDASFEKIAAAEGLDWEAIRSAMSGERVSKRIERNRDIAIALEVLGTPAFVTPNSLSFGQSEIGALAESWLSR